MHMDALRVAAVIAALVVSANGAAAQAQPAPAPPQRITASAADSVGCNSVEKPLSAGGASIVPDTPGQP
jgi:type IV secretory pathway protease TraF